MFELKLNFQIIYNKQSSAFHSSNWRPFQKGMMTSGKAHRKKRESTQTPLNNENIKSV